MLGRLATHVRTAASGVPKTGTAMAAIGLLALTGCGLESASSYTLDAEPGSIKELDLPDDAELTVTSKNFTEQLILGKMAVIAAEVAGFDVVDMTNVPGSVPVRELMVSGQADMTWEYTGTAWLTYLGKSKGIPDQQEQWQAVYDADLKNGLTWGKPAPLNNTYAFAVRSEAIDELGGISKLSDIENLPVEDRTFCIESEFNSRADGFNPMLEHYGLERGTDIPEDNISILDTGAVYAATDSGSCNLGEVFTTDGRVDALDLTVLEDDQGFFPAYNVAPVFNTETLQEFPQLDDVYAQIAPELTDDELRKLNLRVDQEGAEPAEVALDWMAEKGFVTK